MGGDFWTFPLLPDQASSRAWEVDAVFLFALVVLIFFTVLICTLIIAFLVQYRRGTRVDRSNPPRHNTMLEAAWIGIPLVISIIMYVAATVVFFRLYEAPGDASTVEVVGKQWMWYLQHPEGKREINELHVPVGRPVRVEMISQDVIHSFYIPAFRIKQDVLPGRKTSLWFNPTKVGNYHLFCTEYCGSNHSQMGGTIYVLEPADYEKWLDVGSVPTLAKQGEALFQSHHCGGCHGGSQSVKAPPLEGVFGTQVPIMRDDKSTYFVTADDRYIRDSILLPKKEVVAGYEPLMPSFRDTLDEESIMKITAYLKSIGSGSGASAKAKEGMR